MVAARRRSRPPRMTWLGFLAFVASAVVLLLDRPNDAWILAAAAFLIETRPW